MRTFWPETGQNNLMFFMQKGFVVHSIHYTGMPITPNTPDCVTILMHKKNMFYKMCALHPVFFVKYRGSDIYNHMHIILLFMPMLTTHTKC